MANAKEPEKYQVLATIGESKCSLFDNSNTWLTVYIGKGSFGIIHKVKRVSDNHVCKLLPNG